MEGEDSQALKTEILIPRDFLGNLTDKTLKGAFLINSSVVF
jgi:hypothetical protein